MMTTAPGGRNRLAGTTSPYLLQHADNPVNWYPWGPEALEASRRENKPIFLSIGYSACHWCHVMEAESFEDPDTAAVMNKYFISIKVDREERPDLDDIYMTAVQMLTGGGGWPMSVWLTPELKPFYGGTYFPKDSRYGRPSFTQVLTKLGEAWSKDHDSLVAQAGKLHEAVVQYMSGRRTPPGGGKLGDDLISAAIDDMSSNFDHNYGGFGSAPKFPPHRALSLMLARYRRTKDPSLLKMATLTFDRMAQGGMYDQIGGGFHRYSTDPKWLVPHFEKMLYDNALMADAYIDAWQTTGSDLYQRTAREIFDWLLREMTDPEGPFYSTLDADSDGAEGKFYVWRPDEVTAALGPAEGALINEYYGITPKGNFEGGTSIPNVEIPPERFAPSKGIPVAEFMKRLETSRRKLLESRNRRVHPHLDDKILTAWNGLMIESLARGAKAFDTRRYLDAAVKAADFLLKNLRGSDGLMRVSYRKGQVNSEGFLDDQAFFIRGLLALHEATGDVRWLKEAKALVKTTDAAFRDPADGGYFFTPPNRQDLIVRARNPTDGAIPSGNSVMAASLLALNRATGDAAYRAQAAEILTTFRGAMDSMPAAFYNMLGALDDYVSSGPIARSTQSVVTVTARAGAGQPAAGSGTTIEIQVDIKPGWHVNSATPTLPYLIPTSVSLAADPEISLLRIDYPEGKMVTLSFAGKPISVYEGIQTVRVTMRLGAAAAPGTHRVAGSVTFQACNDESCQSPLQKGFAVDLQVVSPPPK